MMKWLVALCVFLGVAWVDMTLRGIYWMCRARKAEGEAPSLGGNTAPTTTMMVPGV